MREGRGREGREDWKLGRDEVEEKNSVIGASIYISACHRFHE